jgi:hypothetical protein
MHWLVEVSRVGDTAPSERYCIDARRWQSALQEARRLRGDSGALPKLTIELTDNGYRAVDPALKVRYLVSEAPPGTPLTDGARAILSTHPPPVESVAPAKGAQAATAASAAPSVAPAPARSGAPAAGTPSLPAGSDASADQLGNVAATASAAPARPGSVPPPSVAPRSKSTPPPPVNPAAFTAATSWPPMAEPTPSDAPAATIPAPEALPESPPFESAPPLAALTSSVPPPSSQVIRQREEKPSAVSPIAYRELALAVRAGTSRAEVEALLKTRLEEIRGTLSTEARRFVQLAVFDHVFVKRPMRPPLGTLVWKDWRGEPTLSFPGFGEGDEPGPPSSVSSARMPSWSASMMTSVVPRLGVDPQPTTLAPAPVAPAPMRSDVPPVGSLTPARVLSVGPSKQPESSAAAVAPVAIPAPAPVPSAVPAPVATTAPVAPAATTVPAPAAPERPSSEPPAELATVRVPAESTLPAGPRSSEPAPASAAPGSRRSDPALVRRSDPPSRRSDPSLIKPHRRAPGEDLIGDLFERMHELMFMGDIPSGADYVLNVLFDCIPCEAMLVHVFDLGRREFVVVRAHGPSMRNALLFRTPDSDPLVGEIMRRQSFVTNGASPLHSGAFDRLGVQTKQIMSGAARQGGRYLGIIELANPLGGDPFHENERNALEYVCEQFAEFVASRPLVLDEDIILRA